MRKTSNLDTYRDIWLIGSAIVICSTFLSYVYDDSLISIMQNNIPKIFDSFYNPSLENIVITVVDAGFILLMLGATLCVISSWLVGNKSRILTKRGGIRLWNGSSLELTALILFSSPVFMYENGGLVRLLSFLGTEYSPRFEGLGIGYYVTWIGVITSIIAGRAVNARIQARLAVSIDQPTTPEVKLSQS